jgi:hypothetical protein
MMVDAILGVCWSWCQFTKITWRDRERLLSYVYCNDGRDVVGKESDGG